MDSLEAGIKGWTLRGIYDDPRLTELASLYEDLGFRVHLAPCTSALVSGCKECLKHTPEKYKVLYTKKMDIC